MIEISAVGDVFLGDYTISLGFGIKSSIKNNGFDYHFENIKNIFKNKDLVIGNLETIISDIGMDERDIKSIICRGDKGSVNVLKNAGFNMVNIANIYCSTALMLLMTQFTRYEVMILMLLA